MDEHIEKCIKSSASQRRLRTIFNLRASATGVPVEEVQSQPSQTTTVVLTGMLGLESVFASIVSNALARFPGLDVEIEHAGFGRTPDTNIIRFFLTGPPDHLKGATIRIQVRFREERKKN